MSTERSAFDHHLAVRLLAAENTREFLQLLVDTGSGGKGWSYTQLARKCGFPSRAHCREIVNGQRGLTIGSFRKLRQGLGLKGEWRRYFETLVAFDNPRIMETPIESPKLHQRRERLRSKLLQRYDESSICKEPAPSLAQQRVFAALGTSDSGSTITEIVRRSKLSEETVRGTLSVLVAAGSVLQVANGTKPRFAASQSHWATQNLGAKPEFVQVMTDSLRRAEERVVHQAKSPLHLFLASSFSIKQERLPELKQELQELLLGFIDQAEDPTGDVVVDLVIASGPES